MNTHSLISRAYSAYAAVRRFFGFPPPTVPAKRITNHRGRPPASSLRASVLRFIVCCLWLIAYCSQAAAE
ncbi:MAG: hypothetical protein GY862_36760 [Gammaproteobacteria bacterium]|nr:hypothetical protein [Gammaproteobacteria bacterium]